MASESSFTTLIGSFWLPGLALAIHFSTLSAKNISDLWGVQFPTDAINCIEDRAKAIKKTINNSPVNGLSTAIKEYLPDALNEFGSGTRRLFQIAVQSSPCIDFEIRRLAREAWRTLV
ncbi:hypothetical protein ACKAV7_008652 [Fusarium commune]|nr:hypothetical protein LZL87_010594 [Fusarium oxysporum]